MVGYFSQLRVSDGGGRAGEAKRVVSVVIIILEKKKLLGVDESSLRNHALPRV